ncbi:unnamed protein product [Urochloa humidicola]
MLLVALRKKYKSLKKSLRIIWETTIFDAGADYTGGYPSINNLKKIALFQDIIEHAKKDGKPYVNKINSTFRLFRDNFVHGPSKSFDKSFNPWKEKFKNDNGIELMADIIYNLIKERRINITKEFQEWRTIFKGCETACIAHPRSPREISGRSAPKYSSTKNAATVHTATIHYPCHGPNGFQGWRRIVKGYRTTCTGTQEAPARLTFAQLLKDAVAKAPQLSSVNKPQLR